MAILINFGYRFNMIPFRMALLPYPRIHFSKSRKMSQFINMASIPGQVVVMLGLLNELLVFGYSNPEHNVIAIIFTAGIFNFFYAQLDWLFYMEQHMSVVNALLEWNQTQGKI